ncbi:MAG: hypothetical protein Q7R52_04015 [archaeon]|nr:hypothetical protein [archaeon]
MSLKRFLTGNPGNLKEYVDIVNSRGNRLKTNVVLHAWNQAEQTGGETFQGEIVYSYGNMTEVILDKDVRYKKGFDYFSSDISRIFNGERYLDAVMASIQPDLKILRENNINFNIIKVNNVS